MFAKSLSYTSSNPVFFAAPNFWSYGSPAIGDSTWSFRWGASDQGTVTATIDGQDFTGTGTWDALECGHFTVEGLSGDYIDEVGGSTHSFNANMIFTVYSNEISGEMLWNENWSAPDGESGTFRSNDIQITGKLVGAQ